MISNAENTFVAFSRRIKHFCPLKIFVELDIFRDIWFKNLDFSNV